MMRFVMPIILIGIGVAVFFLFTTPLYNSTDPATPGITALRAQVASFDGALDNSKALENQRDILTKKQNAIDPEALARLQKLLPGSIDNIRLILEIEKIAEPYGMTLKDVKYNATENTPKGEAEEGVLSQIEVVREDANKEYGIWDLEFTTSGSYSNFLNFTRDLESNLRIVDISSIQFSSTAGRTSSPQAGSGSSSGGASADSYTYNFKIKTYWLKN